MIKQQKGLGVIWILISLLVILIIGFVGIRVVDSNKTASTHTTTTSKSGANNQVVSENKIGSQKTTASAKDCSYLKIKEWNVCLKPADDSLVKLSYEIDNSDGHQWAKLTFDGLPASCAGLYHLERAKSGQDIDGYGTTPEKYVEINPLLIKHVGEYYYRLGHGQAGCEASEQNNDLIRQLVGSEGSDFTIETL